MPQITISRALAAFLVPVLLYLAYVAGCWGLADVYYRPIHNKLELWKQQKIKLSNNDWDNYQKILAKALKLDPGNPDINHTYGTALEGRYMLLPPGDDTAQQARKEASTYYKNAIAMRPTWPYTWADFALVKYRLNEIDDEFLNALHVSMEMGPWEPGVQLVITFIGLRVWNKINQEEQLFILDTIKKSMSHVNQDHVNKMLKMVDERNILAMVCAHINDNQKVEDYCYLNNI